MSEVLKGESFKKALTDLMKSYSKGNKFSPSFKEIFKPFADSDFKSIDVVIVYPNALQELPEYTADRVLIVRSPLTEGEGLKHMKTWGHFVMDLLKDIAYKTNKTVFVFAGKETEPFKSVVRKGQFKVFVPKEPAFDMKKIHDNINDLLTRNGKEPIKW